MTSGSYLKAFRWAGSAKCCHRSKYEGRFSRQLVFKDDRSERLEDEPFVAWGH